MLKKILYVEDQEDIQIIANIALQTIGNLEVKVCSSGEQALASAVDFAPDLLLLDVMMPVMDGPKTLAALRQLTEIRHTPVVFMTAKIQPQEKKAYSRLGAIGIIEKPFDPMTLAAELQEIWKKR